MANEVFTMWFQDGGGRTTIYGRRELRKYAKQYAFNADEVINRGETEMLCDLDGDVVGGVFKEDTQ
tara:strand:+ start:1035 stop:1232 length:198 start_codon:yes stop_codon:yes gene_type:complete